MGASDIEKTVQSKVKVNFRTLELVFPEPGVATFARSRPMKFALIMAVITAVTMMAGAPLFLVHGGFLDLFGHRWLLMIIPFELIPAVVVTAVLVHHFRASPLVFDRNHGRMWRQGKADPAIGDYALLKDVEAVQVCSGTVSGGSDGRPYQVYELNVVMKRPPGARVPAICHGNRAAMFADAQKLAEFLGVGLLDHADELSLGKRPAKR